VITQNTKKNVISSTSLRGTKQSLTTEEDCRVAMASRNDVVKGHFNVAIIGAGPAGIMAAIAAAEKGAGVVLIEKNEAVGRKILATGNGRCNLTNSNIDISRYHGSDLSFVSKVLGSFDQNETIKYFESIGVITKEEALGRIFPRTNQAISVVDALTARLKALDVTIKTGFTVKSITNPSLSSPASQIKYDKLTGDLDSRLRGNDSDFWNITDGNTNIFTADKIILTTGGKAAHQFGSSGDGLFWAKNLGHTVIPIHAALVPLETEEEWVKELMGIKLNTQASLSSNGKLLRSRTGDVIFTHFGISGPAAMGLAREVDPLLTAGQKVSLSLDITPELTSEKLEITLINLTSLDGKKMIKSILSGLVPKNLVPRILMLASINSEIKAAELSKSQRLAIIETIKSFPLTVSKVRPLKEAQVTAGGVSTTEVGETLESKIVPNLYFAGEILDVDGDSGGFNLQWAWSSGKLAGQSAASQN